MVSKGDNNVGRFAVEFQVANRADVIKAREGSLSKDKVRRLTIRGVVDSGAGRLVLPKSVVRQLGLPLAGKARVRYVDGRTRTRDTAEDAQVEILGRKGTFTAIVEPFRTEALIGAIVLEDLDLLVDCSHQRLAPRDPKIIITEVERMSNEPEA